MAKQQKYWYKITKYVKGGSFDWQICVPKILTSKDKTRIAESIGENTPGGKNYGYSIYVRKLRKESKTIKVLAQIQTLHLWEV